MGQVPHTTNHTETARLFTGSDRKMHKNEVESPTPTTALESGGPARARTCLAQSQDLKFKANKPTW